MFKPISTDKAPAAVGPYSQAIVTDGYIFSSGQIGIDPKSGNLVDGIEAQTKQVLQNIEAVLHAANTMKDHVVKSTIFLTDMNDYTTVNGLYEKFFGDHKPARSTVQVAKLPKDALIEIEVVALHGI